MTSKLYLASITLPMLTNDGESLELSHAWLQATLGHTFGGFTRTSAMGGWMDQATGKEYVEPVAVYAVAISDDEFSTTQLLNIARFAGEKANQLAMFVTLPHGEVRILNAPYTE